MMDLSIAKEKITIPDLWRLRNWPGKPGRSCRVPWREDRAPSGSVFADGKLFYDFASGETVDAPGLLARVEGLTPRAACQQFIGLAGGGTEQRAMIRCPITKSEFKELTLPEMQVPGASELERLANLRSVSVEACAEAARRSHLYMADWLGVRCWLLTDAARRNAQVRQIDGAPFRLRDGSEVKALTLPGACASWPIGAQDVREAKRVVFVEGGGDFLAAYHFAEVEETLNEVQPVAMLGAASQIHADALRILAGKPTRIFPHLDDAGASAALRWENQFREAGIEAHCFDLAELTRADRSPVGDLNDLTNIDVDDFERDRELWAITQF